MARRLAWATSLCALALLAAPLARAQNCEQICFLDGRDRALDPTRDALQVSRFVTNGATFPHDDRFETQSLVVSDLRVQVAGPAVAANGQLVLESRTAAGALRDVLRLPLLAASKDGALRSGFVRLVGDEVDRTARGAEDHTLRVALRDRVVARYGSGARELSVTMRVGSDGDSQAPDAARFVRLNVHILRVSPHGDPVIGHDDISALAVMRRQLSAANEIWLQCDLSFGDPAETALEVVDPPPPCLLAVADDDGLPARGGGELNFRIGDQHIGPIPTRAGAAPVETARDLARALRAHGFFAQVSENTKTRSGAGRSADVLVRRADGSFVSIEPEEDQPLSTDPRQSLQIGHVDLGDGLQEFDNMTAQVGSLEERTLIKALADDDPRTIDLFVVDRFTGATRQGEAFIDDPHAPIVNAVVIDRNGLRHAPLAWTLAHELGHVLMNDPLHPDNVGPDRPWLLMDADSGKGTVDGPKRLRAQDCERVREVAQHAKAPLLVPYDR